MTGDVNPTASALARHRAARVVAANASDAAELGELLDMLGLDPREGRQPIVGTVEPARGQPSVRERAAARALAAALLPAASARVRVALVPRGRDLGPSR